MTALSHLIKDIGADLRYAARALSRTPGFVAVSVLTLAIAIAIGTVGFTAANAFFYRPLPVPEGHELLSVFTSDWSGRDKPGGSSYADVMDFARDAGPIADIGGESRIMLTFSVNDEVAFVQGAVVTPQYFRVTRIFPALGRFPAAPDVPAIVISHSLWRRTFAADSSVIGRKVLVNGRPFIVAAVAPPDFRGINRENGVDFWIDGSLSPIVLLRSDLIERRGYRSFRVIGRLREGASLEALNARLSVTAARLFAEYPQAWRDTTGGGRVVTAMRELDAHGAAIPPGERILLTAGVIALGFGLVIIACMNLASMQMARGAARRREIATRLALGAGRGRLIRQLLAECGLVAVPGIAAGVAMAYAVGAMLTHYRPIPLPSWDMTLDWRALAFITGALLITLLVFGLVPALQTVRADLVVDLKGGEQTGATGLRIGGLRGSLIVAQVALSLMFTASPVLMTLGLARFADEGRADARMTLVSRVNFLPGGGDSSRVEATLSELLEAIRAIPGVEAVSAASSIPMRGSRTTVFAEMRTKDGQLKQRELDANFVRSGYPAVVGIRILRGRDFGRGDAARSSVALVSKSMADALWPGEDALGKRLRIDEHQAPAEVVGVIADPPGFVPATDHSYPGLIYLPLAAGREAEVILHVRVPAGQDAVAGQVRQLLRRYTTQLVAPRPITLDAYFDEMLLPLRMIAEGSGAIAAVQFLLAIAGLSGLVGYVTEMRRREIGIRTALGATPGSVLRLVMRQGVRLTMVGGAIGLALSGAVAVIIAESLPMTATIAVGGLVSAMVVFAGIAMIAMLIPAQRALAVTPAVALQAD